ncbi:ATP-binding protein [Acidiplasma sp. MBA-1]|uniref:ATP-binding protein n=1 Tax=Acidiplasma sp. MBA-1 TaxID=1293648 RepID=UPI0005DC57B9|nr:ATP-binding protein [Acidiplasma sp. MBA-1]KJE49328.1 hypothetical protein TZ01_04550 [Acidiplasma sp. MBA-1]
MSEKEQFETRISLQVSVQIIKHISRGLYRSASSAIKELVSNSFDADANNVVVKWFFSYDKSGTIMLKQIEVSDDGEGMNLDNLIYSFTHIGGSAKELNENLKTKSGRPVIGRLGIGMLSVASACRGFRVITKKEHEEREYISDVSLEFLDQLRELTDTMDKFNIGNVKISSRSVSGYEKYTKIQISDFRPPFLAGIIGDLPESYFFSKKIIAENSKESESYIVRYIEEKLGKGEKLLKLSQFDQILTELALMAPIKYLSDGPVRKSVPMAGSEEYSIPGTDNIDYLSLKKRLEDLNFRLYYEMYIEDEKVSKFELFKPLRYPLDSDLKLHSVKELDPYVIVVGPVERKILNDVDEEVETKISGYVYHQNMRILPHEFRGILFRVYNVAIGTYFQDELRLYSEDPVILHQMLIEVYLDEGFQSAVNLDRESLFEGSRVVIYLRAFLENFLKGKAPTKPANMEIHESNVKDGQETHQESSTMKPTESRVPPVNSELSTYYTKDLNFLKELNKLFPEGKGVISDIKTRMSNQRKIKVSNFAPINKLKQKVIDDFNVGSVNFEPSSINDVGFSLEHGKALIRIPKLKRVKNADLWETVLAVIAVWGPSNKEEKVKLAKVIYDLFQSIETK